MKKTEIISFKADASLLEALDGVDNRSRFIRNAVVSALRNTCPLCGGTGALTPNQQKHWEELSKEHSIARCEHCNEPRIVCSRDRQRTPSSKDGEAVEMEGSK